MSLARLWSQPSTAFSSVSPWECFQTTVRRERQGAVHAVHDRCWNSVCDLGLGMIAIAVRRPDDSCFKGLPEKHRLSGGGQVYRRHLRHTTDASTYCEMTFPSLRRRGCLRRSVTRQRSISFKGGTIQIATHSHHSLQTPVGRQRQCADH